MTSTTDDSSAEFDIECKDNIEKDVLATIVLMSSLDVSKYSCFGGSIVKLNHGVDIVLQEKLIRAPILKDFCENDGHDLWRCMSYITKQGTGPVSCVVHNYLTLHRYLSQALSLNEFSRDLQLVKVHLSEISVEALIHVMLQIKPDVSHILGQLRVFNKSRVSVCDHDVTKMVVVCLAGDRPTVTLENGDRFGRLDEFIEKK